jgi:hypothetical protein
MKIELKNKLGKVYYSVEHDQANGWNYCTWTGYVTVEEVKQACLQGLALISSNRCPDLLNDNSQISGPWSGANEWIATEWMPKALGMGLKRFAHVVSPNVFAALSASQLVSRVEGMNFEMRIFQTRTEAQKWLRDR